MTEMTNIKEQNIETSIYNNTNVAAWHIWGKQSDLFGASDMNALVKTSFRAKSFR